MLKNNVLLIVSLLCTSCQSTKRFNDCFVTAPVRENHFQRGVEGSLEEFTFRHTYNADSLLNAIVRQDTIMGDKTTMFVTHYANQKNIHIAFACYKKLEYPNQTFLREIYNTSAGTAKALLKGVRFIKSYQKKVYKYGTATIFEYDFEEVCSACPHHLFLIIKQFENRIGKDYNGYAFCSDGLEWIESADSTIAIPVYVASVRWGTEYFIPLVYENQRFIPVGHFKKGEW